jgi:hypothetical protein
MTPNIQQPDFIIDTMLLTLCCGAPLGEVPPLKNGADEQ